MVRHWYELSDYVGLRRVNGLRLSPDGTRLVAPVSEPEPDGKTFGTALWEIDPGGRQEPRRLTRSTAGESAPGFLPDGSVLFVSTRPDPESSEGEADAPKPGLWLLPADGGEARRVASPPGGIGSFAVARDSGTVVYSAGLHPRSTDTEAEERLRAERRDAGVTAILHEDLPVRFWDSDIGPAHPRLHLADPPEDGASGLGEARDLTPDAGLSLHDHIVDIAPDGRTVLTDWQVPAAGAEKHTALVAVDGADGGRRILASDPRSDFVAPKVSPDGRYVALVRDSQGEYDGEPHDSTLWLVELATGEQRDMLPAHDLWPRDHAWAADSSAVFLTADFEGRRPVYRVDLATAEVTRVTGDDGAYSELNPAPDGTTLYALRDSWDSPPTPVRIDTAAAGAAPVRLKAPEERLEVPGSLTEVETVADDGTRIRSWLVLPEEASAESPAPLLLWVHGGPYMSFNGWSWRWNPWLMAARGYAVLLPDPALSTGYGQDMLRRGWGRWGPRTFADLMAITDAASAREDIDGDHTAMMGGSFGGYMANWIAGHTGRFKAIVSHASLWTLSAFGGATDYPSVWAREFGDPRTHPERYELNSPHLSVANISTPMLVIHGDKDYRSPLGESLRLWWDLLSHGVEAKFLYFPDENHWILTPGNIKVWYETIFSFLDHHVHGKEWRRPQLL